MRTGTLIVAAGLALLVGIGYLADWRLPNSPFFPREKRYLLVPGPVTGSREAGIRAVFELVAERRVDPGEQGQSPILIQPGIRTNYEGGACVVLSADDLGLTTAADRNCENDEQCTFTGVEFGYCAPAGKRCWVKPQSIAAKLCRKSRQEGVTWQAGVINPLPKDGVIDLAPLGLPANRPVRSRVITCLERSDATAQTGCKARGAGMVEKWGPAREL